MKVFVIVVSQMFRDTFPKYISVVVICPKNSVESCTSHHICPRYAPLFQITPDSVMIYKGTEATVDSYSSFFDNQRYRETKLRSVLEKKGVTDLYVCGIATDICVGMHKKAFHKISK